MKKVLLSIVMILLIAGGAVSQDFSNFPITKIKVNPNVIVYKAGLTGAYSNMVAVKTSGGIVVIDALQYPEVAKRVREMITKDLNGEVKYLINSHGAFDHTGGNIAFDDVPIIGCADVKREMQMFQQMEASPQFESFVQEQMIKKPEEMRASYIGDKREIDESIELYKNLLKSIKDNTFKIVIPDTLFDDHYTLKVGNTTFNMYHNTPSYSRSDIIIYIPEEKTLVMADIFNNNRIPVINRNTDLKKWEALFEPYLNGKIEVKHFIGTHGKPLPLDEMKNQFNYIKTLFKEVEKIKSAGKTMVEAIDELALTKLPYLSKYNPYFYGTAMNQHEMNIKAVWGLVK